MVRIIRLIAVSEMFELFPERKAGKTCVLRVITLLQHSLPAVFE